MVGGGPQCVKAWTSWGAVDYINAVAASAAQVRIKHIKHTFSAQKNNT